MIQLNLMPDVKLQYIKVRQRKRLVIGISVITSAVFIVILIFLLLYVRVAQKKHMDDLSKDIVSSIESLKAKPDLDKILTIQNQLSSLPALHDQKVISSRLFDYLTQIVPQKATVSDVTLDVAAGTLNIKGNADNLSTVNKFADTLKFTSFLANEDLGEGQMRACPLGKVDLRNDARSEEEKTRECKAFTEVVLSGFSISELNDTSQPTSANTVSYELQFKYDPVILANIKTKPGAKAIELKVPKIISTRSSTESPGNLFAPQPKTNSTEGL